MEDEILDQTPVKLYIMVRPPKQEKKTILINSSFAPSLKDVLPTREILQTHFQAERIRVQIAKRDGIKGYIPQPLYLAIENGIFVKAKEEVAKKNVHIVDDCIVLTLGTNMPCCIMTPRPEINKSDERINEEKHD